MALGTLVGTVLCLLITVWVMKLLHVVWWQPKRIEKELRDQGICGRPYKLLFGNLREMLKMSKEAASNPLPLDHDFLPRLNPFLHRMIVASETITVVWFGTSPRVIIKDPKLAKEVMVNKSGDFRKPEITPSMKLFSAGLAIIEGDKWAIHRKIINPAFHIEKLKLMLPAFSECSGQMIKKWNKLADITGSCELDISTEFHNLTGDVISHAAFGSNCGEGRLIFLLQHEQGVLFVRTWYNNVFPLLRFLPTKSNKRMRHIYKEVQAILSGIVKKREKEIKAGKEHRDNLLGLLIKSNLDELEQDKSSKMGMSIEEVIEECKQFYFAGQETTANLLTWSMVVLSMHKSWQEQARKEVLQIIGKKKPTYDELNSLKMMHLILQEVLRLYPPTSLIRRTYKKTMLGDMSLPAGVELMVPLHSVHRDPEIWGEDALQFNPLRFSGKSPTAYFPFGWGPRMCVGQNFALLEAKVVLTEILQNFSFELSPGYAHAPTIVITLQPKYGAQIILHKL